jgi:serine O-acetyltransferase
MMSKKGVSLNNYSVPHGSWGAEKLYYLSHWLWEKNCTILCRAIKLINTLLFRNYIDSQCKIGKRLELAHGGFGVVINYDTLIGDDAIIFHNVTMGNKGIRIGHRVYIGTGATIIGPCEIGDDVAIGANTFVNFNVPSGVTVVGAKGRIVDSKKTANQGMESIVNLKHLNS